MVIPNKLNDICPPYFMQMIFTPSRASRHFDVALGGAPVGAPLPRPGTLLLITLRVQSGVPPTCTTKASWLFVVRLLQMWWEQNVCVLPVLAYKPLIIRDNNSECHYSTLQYDNKEKKDPLLLYLGMMGFFLTLLKLKHETYLTSLHNMTGSDD